MKIPKLFKNIRRIIITITIVLMVINIILVMCSGKPNVYLIAISISNPILIYIHYYYIKRTIDGIKNKKVQRIIKSKDYVFDKTAIKYGFIYLGLSIITILIMAYFEIWLMYWLFG